MDKQRAIESLAALSQETRLDAFRLLIQAGPDGIPAGSISSRLDTVQNTMSAHLNVLYQAGLVQKSRNGRTIQYKADYDSMRELLTYLVKD